jgi:hypothetical protein
MPVSRHCFAGHGKVALSALLGYSRISRSSNPPGIDYGYSDGSS